MLLPDGVELHQRGIKPASRKAFTLDDALFILEWPILKFAATAMAETRWADVAMRLERIKVRLGQTSPAKRAAIIQRALSLASIEEAEAIAWRAAAARTEHHIQVLKVLSAKGWSPRMQIEGEEHLRAAMARGQGAVLWVAHFCFNTQVTKMALARGGYRVSHLSRPEHGFSKSQFGIRFLNPLRWNAERAYLDSRIVIDRSRSEAALNEAEAVLRQNRIVSITAGQWEGRRLASAPLLGGRYTLAAGAPNLAYRTGAVLLPVITTRARTGGSFTVKIGQPLATEFADKADALRAATAGFLNELEPAIRDHPDQWRGWNYLEV